MRNKFGLHMLMIFMLFLLTGCGTPMVELTAEEEALIVHSAAYFVAKHNIHQKDGAIHVPDDLKEHLESSDSDIVLDDNSQSEEPVSSPVGGILISCCDKTISKDYIEGNAYAIYADVGKSLCIFQLRLQNTTHEDITIDNLTSKTDFKLVYDKTIVNAESTFLNNDLSTYQGIVPAHNTIDAILIFEINDSDIEFINDTHFEMNELTIAPTPLPL